MHFSTGLIARRAAFTGRTSRWSVMCMLFVLLVYASPALAQLEFESEPINYETAPTHDPVQVLIEKMERGESKLPYEDDHGYLKAVLQHLDVPVSSQMLVFSKTSFQLRRITPQRPRAVYFSDDVYVGWVQGGDVVEVSAVDPHLGAVFYTISQERLERPQVTRDRGQCIVCHASSRTLGVPGHLVRSVYASRSGQPFFGSGTFTNRSPQSLQRTVGRLVRDRNAWKPKAYGQCLGHGSRPSRKARRGARRQRDRFERPLEHGTLFESAQ